MPRYKLIGYSTKSSSYCIFMVTELYLIFKKLLIIVATRLYHFREVGKIVLVRAVCISGLVLVDKFVSMYCTRGLFYLTM